MENFKKVVFNYEKLKTTEGLLCIISFQGSLAVGGIKLSFSDHQSQITRSFILSL